MFTFASSAEQRRAMKAAAVAAELFPRSVARVVREEIESTYAMNGRFGSALTRVLVDEILSLSESRATSKTDHCQ